MVLKIAEHRVIMAELEGVIEAVVDEAVPVSLQIGEAGGVVGIAPVDLAVALALQVHYDEFVMAMRRHALRIVIEAQAVGHGKATFELELHTGKPLLAFN